MRGASMVGMFIADKKSTHHHHHHHQSVAGHDHHHQTDLSSSERERGPDDSDEEGYGRLLTFPHPISITIPYLPGCWQVGRLATGRIYLVAARHGKGGRKGGRESPSRKGGEESGSGLWHLLFSVFCFLFLLFWSPDIFWGVLVRFIDLTHFIFPSDSDELLAITIHAWRSNRQDRTGQVRWVNHHTKRLPNVGIPEQSIKFAKILCAEKISPLASLHASSYMLCPNIDTYQ